MLKIKKIKTFWLPDSATFLHTFMIITFHYADPAMRMTLENVAEHSWVVGNDGRMPHYLCWCKRRRRSLSIREECNGTKDD